MDDDDKYQRYANIPIPTYDEATASDAASSRTLRGPSEASDDAERQNLLGQHPDDASYRRPTVESARSSADTLDGLRYPGDRGGNDDDARRQIEELDYLDPSAPDTSRRSPRLYHRARLRLGGGARKWSQGLSTLSATLAAIRMPSFRSLYTPLSSDSATATIEPTTRFGRMRQHLHIPEQYRMSAPTAARLCGLFTLLGLIYILFALDIFPGGRRLRGGAHFDPESVRAFVQENVAGENIEAFLAHITSFDHVAGTEGDLYLAKWMEELWLEGGYMDQVALLPYYVYLNYPGERSVSIVAPEAKRWTARLDEEQVYPDRQQTMAWHAHSRSGEVQGPLIYANGGSKEDFAYLRDQGIVTSGTIALIKSGGGDLSAKVRAAESAGCIGVLLYSDPSDVPADAIWRPSADMVQRGSVGLSNHVMGDPLTPGFASTLDASRLSKDGNPGLPKIPSLPLSWRDAKVLISSLETQGVKAPPKWVHGPADFSKEWFTGNASSSPADTSGPIIHLKNLNEENPLQQIWNLHAMIEGLESPSKKIVIGNHRDAFCFSAVDPGSGSAVLMEVVRIFAELRKLGWRPLRTIEFVSWDAGAFDAVGSTEYVEDHVEAIRDDGIAYLNVGAGVSGSTFRAGGSPVWQKPLLHVLGRVGDPGGNVTLKQLWDQHGSQLSGLNQAGGDYVPFQSLAGKSSIDFGFVAGGAAPDSAAGGDYYPSRSCHETFEWMAEFGDPGFHYHRTLAQVWALLILEIADRPLIPFDLKIYVGKLHEWITTLEREVVGTYATLAGVQRASASEMLAQTNFTLQPLKAAADQLAQDVEAFGRFEDVWTSQVLGSGGLETTQFALRRGEYNDRLAHFETGLLDLEQGRGGQFRHVVFGPRGEEGGGGYFPGVRDKVAVGDWVGAAEVVGRAAERVVRAGRGLVL
ncbi:hypothetical protein LTR08_008518 [Meristemomyces frigidus]|nr:hypothetical protein LTR08_008518 [Meristemomyces frigidus]